MISFLNRLALLVALTLSGGIAFLFSDLFSSTYTSAAENFFSGGWVFALFLLFFIKGVFLSRSSIETAVGEYLQNKPSTLAEERSFTQDLSYSLARSPLPTIEMEPSESEIPLPPEMEAEEDVYDTPDMKSTIETNTIEESDDSVSQRKNDTPSWIVEFFSDRPLAKIGGILLFLGALFFLSLVWSYVGAVGKISMGIVFGFCLYGIGVWMDQKGHTTESRTLMGVGIAINTLTILSGRWIIGDGVASAISDTTTLVFLLLNTLFAVVTALVYSSRTFLIFSFVFAYIIPFLVGSHAENTILFTFYITIISTGGYALSHFLSLRGKPEDATWLSKTVLLGGTLLMLFVATSMHMGEEVLIYLIINTYILLLAITTFRRIQSTSTLPAVILSSYIVLAFGLFSRSGDTINILLYTLFLLPLVCASGYLIFTLGFLPILASTMIFPLIFGIILLGVYGIDQLIFVLVPIMLVYFVSGFIFFRLFSLIFRYIYFLAATLFLAILSFSLDVSHVDINSFDRTVLALFTLLTFCTGLFVSLLYKLNSLSFISLFSSIILFVFILSTTWIFSWTFFIIFLLIAFLFPVLFYREEEWKNGILLIAYQVFLNIFMVGEIVYLGKNIWFTDSSTSLITLGAILFLTSLGSLLYAFLVSSRMRSAAGAPRQLSELPISVKNTLSGVFAIPLSLFSLAVAVIFSDNALIVATVWILESTILAYFSPRSPNKLILSGSLLLLFIGLIRILPFFDTIDKGDWLSLIPIIIIGASLFSGVRLVPDRKREPLSVLYDVLHIALMIALGVALMKIIPSTSFGWSLLGMSIFVVISLFFYSVISSPLLGLWSIVLAVFYFLYHFFRMGTLDMTFFACIIQLTSLALMMYVLISWRNRSSYFHGALVFGTIMTLIITSMYVNNITENVFAVTIYLSFIASTAILFGIHKNKPVWRTIGLYIGLVALVKILFYDIWVGVDNLIVRVLALMISGGLMIWLSQLYGKHVDRSWSLEFSLGNFSFDPKEKNEENSDEPIPFSENIAHSLRDIDITSVSAVKMSDPSGNILLESKRAGLLRMACYITTQLQKSTFAPGELTDVFEKVLPNIESKLPKEELSTLLGAIRKWIEMGGEVTFTQKK